MQWSSISELCLANFLYERGIKMRMGKLRSYIQFTKEMQQFISFNIYIISTINNIENKWTGIKIVEKYSTDICNTNESFNSIIHVTNNDCYSVERLTDIMNPYIGTVEPYVHEDKHRELVNVIQEITLKIVKKNCNYIIEHNNGIMPSDDWLINLPTNRDDIIKRTSFENGISMSMTTLMDLINMCGGSTVVKPMLN